MPPSGAALKRLMRELNELRRSPPEGIRIQTNEEDMLDVTGVIEGPEGTPYAGGYFKVRFSFTEQFPAAPPKCWFATKIFHPNVGPTGEICVNTLKKDWKSTYGVGHILVTVKCLLIYPNPESALDEEAGKLFMENYETYCSRAKLFTGVHARGRPEEFDTPSNPDGEAKANLKTTAPPLVVVPEPVASSSKAPSPAPTSSTPSASIAPSSTISLSKPSLLPPTLTRKASSPAPPSLKSSSMDKEGSTFKQERHTSPAPLSTADANVAGNKLGLVGSALGLGLAPTGGLAGASGNSGSGSKSMKRAATNSAVSGAEKRKKALKRL